MEKPAGWLIVAGDLAFHGGMDRANLELARHLAAEEAVQVGQEVEVKVLRVDPKERKIGLSMRQVDDGQGSQEAAAPAEDSGEAPSRSRESKRELRSR